MAPCGAKLAEAMGFANFVEPKMAQSSPILMVPPSSY
jgi:hypothetical protein